MHHSHQWAAQPGPASACQMLDGVPRQLRLDQATRLAPRSGGWLQVQQGRLWLTRSGESADHVLEAGQGLALRPGDSVVAEPWRAGQPVLLRWTQTATPGLAQGLAQRLGRRWPALAT